MINKPMNEDNTIIGETIIVRGELNGDENLTVLGRVEGQINLSQDLFIEETGIVKADSSVRNCVISGILVGNITASERVEIAPGGRMVGDINAPRILINDGAKFRGSIDMGDMESAGGGGVPSKPSYTSRSYRPATTSTATSTRTAAPAPRPAPVAAEKPTPTPAAMATATAPSKEEPIKTAADAKDKAKKPTPKPADKTAGGGVKKKED
jgi:cytoskeletal protein CcmA (bactofilin family)